jgi:hypothetical protein
VKAVASVVGIEALLMLKQISSFLLILFFLLVLSCGNSLMSGQSNTDQPPELGSIIRVDKGLTKSSEDQISIPRWDVISVSVQILPFDKRAYVKYNEAFLDLAKPSSEKATDSLEIKPTFFKLRIKDLVQMVDQLNASQNLSLREYLQTDQDFKVVTSIKGVLPEQEAERLLDAEAIWVQVGEYGNLVLSIKRKEIISSLNTTSLNVFDLEYSSFCWSEDAYGSKIIRNLVPEGVSCPKGTYIKPTKLFEDEEFSDY